MGIYRFHREVTATLGTSPEAVFTLLDDPARLTAHMGRRSAMLAGGRMLTETDERRGQAVGSVIRMSGRILGVSLSLEEVVVERIPQRRKTWKTLGDPRLLVIGHYGMGFDLTPSSHGSSLRIWIDYNLPVVRWQRWLGWFFGRFYADWCVRMMLQAATQTVNGEI